MTRPTARSRCHRPAAPAPLRAHGGFTLLELMLVLTIIAVTMVFVLPKFNDDTKLRLMAAASILRSDIEYAQVLTVANPEDPVLVHFDASKRKYWLARVAQDNEPILRPGGGDPYLVEFGMGRAASSGTLNEVNLHDIDGEKLKFNPQGGLLDPSKSPDIKLRIGTQWIRLFIAPTTGTITQTYGVDS